MNDNLKLAIKNIYTVFLSYAGNQNMKGSPNYGNSVNEWNKKLFSKPLTVLNEGDLSKFTGKVITTWGNVNDLKHFLPRILELTAEYKTPYEIWITLDKLEFANWKDWIEEEKIAIIDYLESLFDYLLNDESSLAEWNFTDYFTSIIYYHPNFNKLIELLEENKSKAKYMHLSNFIIEQGELIFRKGKINGFKTFDRNAMELKNWLLNGSLVQEFSESFFKYENEDFSDRLSWTEQILSNEIKNAENKVQNVHRR